MQIYFCLFKITKDQNDHESSGEQARRELLTPPLRTKSPTKQHVDAYGRASRGENQKADVPAAGQLGRRSFLRQRRVN